MHYTTYGVVLAAGSCIASVSASTFDHHLVSTVGKVEKRNGPSVLSAASLTKQTKDKPPVAKQDDTKSAVLNGSNKSAANDDARNKQIGQAVLGNKPNPISGSPGAGNQIKLPAWASPAKPMNPRLRKYMEKVDDAAAYAAEYVKRYRELAPPGLANSQPPPVNFNLGDTVQNKNDYSQTAYDGSTILRDGAKLDKSQVDNSKNFNIGNGAYVGDAAVSKMTRRQVVGSYEINEDGFVVHQDFKLLVEAMRRDPEAKNQVLYEIAGVPGLRSITEDLIQQYTVTDAQLTMVNFAALVEAMGQDEDVARAVIKAFNSNQVYAFLVEKLLTRYYKSQDQSFNTRDVDDEYSLFDVRSLDENTLNLHSRDIYSADQEIWLNARAIEQEHTISKRSNAAVDKLLAEAKAYTKDQGNHCQALEAPRGKGLRASCKSGAASIKFAIDESTPASPPKPKVRRSHEVNIFTRRAPGNDFVQRVKNFASEPANHCTQSTQGKYTVNCKPLGYTISFEIEDAQKANSNVKSKAKRSGQFERPWLDAIIWDEEW